MRHTKGANLDHHDKTGTSALHAAAQEGHPEVVKALIDAGAALDITDNRGFIQKSLFSC